MQIRQQFTVDAPQDKVAAQFSDVPAMARCVPGVDEVTEKTDNTYEATLSVQMGPIRARFAGELEIDDSQSPDVFVAKGRGRDRATHSQVTVDVEGRLTEAAPHSTEVTVIADIAIRGKLGQFGTGVIQSAASEMTKAFAECFNQSLRERAALAGAETATGGQAAGPAATEPTARAQRQISVVRLVSRALRQQFLGWLRRLRNRKGSGT